MKNAYRLAMLIREVYALSMSAMDQEVARAGVTPQQLIVMKLIGHHGGIQNNQLCEEMHLSKGTVSGIVRRLEERGLVQSTPIPENKRSAMITFTDEGEKFAEDFREMMTESFEHLFKNTSEADIERYRSVLRELAQKMKG